jgi:hypothetical protein
MESSSQRSTPERVPLVPPHRAAERGTLASSTGTEQRNGSGTVGLKALAEQALSRIRSGTQARNNGGTERSAAFQVGGTEAPVVLADGMCEHIAAAARRHPANDGRRVLCCQCFLLAHPDWRPRPSAFFASIEALKRYAVGGAQPPQSGPNTARNGADQR